MMVAVLLLVAVGVLLQLLNFVAVANTWRAIERLEDKIDGPAAALDAPIPRPSRGFRREP